LKKINIHPTLVATFLGVISTNAIYVRYVAQPLPFFWQGQQLHISFLIGQHNHFTRQLVLQPFPDIGTIVGQHNYLGKWGIIFSNWIKRFVEQHI
jgi:hypothetical protein